MDVGEGADGATLTLGPTSAGMVRIVVEEGGAEIPMDFEAEKAVEITDEVRAAAERARAAARRRVPAKVPAGPDAGRRQ